MMQKPDYRVGGARRIRVLGKANHKGGGIQTGYPGLTYTASRIADFIPNCKIFVEPFAGLGRISKYVKAEKKVLNDLSEYAFNHNKKSGNIVTKEDFIECVKKWDSEDTYFFFDPPWEMTSYSLNPKTVCDRTISDYYQQILDLCKNMKGNWMVAGRSSGRSRSTVTVYFKEYFSQEILSNKRMYGFRAKTKLFSNLPFIRHQQKTLDRNCST